VLQKDRSRSHLSPDLRFTFTLKPGEEVIPAIKTLLQTLSDQTE
jgi:hypothetical protein